uniref:Uncharacterized protein n=1 Tax=Plectus sambesii TaxID=2011161 RepID=A0A914UPV3_9BILA
SNDDQDSQEANEQFGQDRPSNGERRPPFGRRPPNDDQEVNQQFGQDRPSNGERPPFGRRPPPPRDNFDPSGDFAKKEADENENF